jgi:chemotaxis protein CheC
MKNENESGSRPDGQIDAFREVCNICAGHAAMALSQLVDKKVGLSVPEAYRLSLAEVPDLFGGPEVYVTAVYLRMEGDCSGSILLVLDAESAHTLAKVMVKSGAPACAGQEVEVSAVQETGSILFGAYLNALGRLTGLRLRPTVPALAMDMAGAIIGCVLADLDHAEDFVLAVETRLQVSGKEIAGHLMMLPDSGTLAIINTRLGVKLE